MYISPAFTLSLILRHRAYLAVGPTAPLLFEFPASCFLPSTAAPLVASRGAVALWEAAGLRCADSMNLVFFTEVQIGFLHQWPTAPPLQQFSFVYSPPSLGCLHFVSDVALLFTYFKLQQFCVCVSRVGLVYYFWFVSYVNSRLAP